MLFNCLDYEWVNEVFGRPFFVGFSQGRLAAKDRKKRQVPCSSMRALPLFCGMLRSGWREID